MSKKTNPKSNVTRFQQISQILKSLRLVIKNRNYFKAFRAIEKLNTTLVLANIELGKLDHTIPHYTQRIREFNQAIIYLTKGKWFATQAIENQSKKHWKKAFQNLKKGIKLAEELHVCLVSGERKIIEYEESVISSNGTEILFADGIPLVPEICPIVILEGSDYEMGYQYAQQLVQIFGKWILERKICHKFAEEDKLNIKEWEKYVKTYAPEIISMCEGWVAGANDLGIAMSYYDVLDIWTGHLPPATNYHGRGEGTLELPRLACSGVAAWGKASLDGKLVAGSSGDHDCTYMVTIVAFPETGNNFILTPFSVTGDVPLVGQTYMMGHPGMNNKGLAYVEHGGMPRFIEPKNLWGYGLRLGTSIFHILRFANSAKEAKEMELSYPVGDVGRHGFGSVGGFYADSTYGYVLESRKDPVIIRETGDMEETDFLYATNSPTHPNSSEAEWIQKNPENWRWDNHGGWYPRKFKMMKLFSRDGIETRFLTNMGYTCNNSRGRNLYLYNMMEAKIGLIDLKYMKTIYQKSGKMPQGSLKDMIAKYRTTGQWEEYSAGHPGNALVAIMKPENGNTGIYALCTGTAARGLTPNGVRPAPMGISGNPIYGETNAFWELELTDTPAGVNKAAKKIAQKNIEQAIEVLNKITESHPIYPSLKKLLDLAKNEFTKGESIEKTTNYSGGNHAIYSFGKVIRAYTRAQVRAQQVCQTFNPPSRDLEKIANN